MKAEHPLSIAVLKKIAGKYEARKLSNQDVQEQQEHIKEIEKRIGDYPEKLLEEAEAAAPPAPPTEDVTPT